MRWRLSLRQSVHRFRSREDGTGTISFVLWLPVVLGILLAFADLSFILFQRSNIVRVVEDANRLRAIGLLNSNDATEASVLAALGYGGGAPGVFVTSLTAQGVLTTEVTIPIAELDAFGMFAGLAGNPSLRVASYQLIENWEM